MGLCLTCQYRLGWKVLRVTNTLAYFPVGEKGFINLMLVSLSLFSKACDCVSLANIRLGWKVLPGTNTLAYFPVGEKGFITLMLVSLSLFSKACDCVSLGCSCRNIDAPIKGLEWDSQNPFTIILRTSYKNLIIFF